MMTIHPTNSTRGAGKVLGALQYTSRRGAGNVLGAAFIAMVLMTACQKEAFRPAAEPAEGNGKTMTVTFHGGFETITRADVADADWAVVDRADAAFEAEAQSAATNAEAALNAAANSANVAAANAATSPAPQTRTELGKRNDNHYPTLWTQGDKISVTLASKNSEADSVVIVPTIAEDRKSFTFNANVPVSEVEKDAFCALSPAIANKSLSNTNKTWNLEIPATQTPTASSPDPQAMLLWARSEFAGTPPEADLAFHHITAYGRIILENFNPGAARIQAISIESSVKMVGRYFFFIDEGTRDEVAYHAGDIVGNVPSGSLTILTDTPRNIWFACFPMDMSGATLNITVKTEYGTFSKAVTVPEGKKFEAGKVTPIKLDMAGLTLTPPDTFHKVTHERELKDGDELLLAAYGTDKNDASYKGWFALTDSQKGNNRQAGLTEVKDGSMIIEPAANIEHIILEKAATEGSWYLRATKTAGYLYAAATGTSSNNYLRTSADGAGVDDFETRRTWDILVGSDGVATITSALYGKQSNWASILRLNTDNLVSNPIISCYKITSTLPKPSIFRKGEPAPAPDPDSEEELRKLVERQWVMWDGGGGVYYDEDGFMIEEGKRLIFDIGVTAKGKLLIWDEAEGSLGFFSGYDSGPYTVKRTPEGHIMIANGTENTENYNFFVLEDTTPYYTRRRIYSYSYDPILYGEHPQIFKDSYGYYWGDRSGKGMQLTALATPITFEGYRFPGIVLNGKKFGINGTEYDGYDHTQHFMDDVMQGKACTLPIVRMNNTGTAEDFAKVDVRGKIAVVDRGEISFWIKLQNASEAGAIAVFCANNQPGTVNANLSELPSSVKKIPFLTITQDQGATLNGKTEADFVIAPVPFYASGE